MPELPEVETFRRYFELTSLGRRILEVRVNSPRILDRITPETLNSLLKGKSFVRAVRHGKNLLAEIEGGGVLLMHFGMTGYLKFFTDPSGDTPHDRLCFVFEEGFLAYDNRRMIGNVGHFPDVGTFLHEKGLGPDVLSISGERFVAVLSGRRGAVKGALMDQKAFAGIGNEYSDEILFQARIHPETNVAALGGPVLHDLHRIAREVLTTAVDRNAVQKDYPQHYLLTRRGRGGNCPRCSTMLATLTTGGRTAYFCPSCQSPSMENTLT